MNALLNNETSDNFQEIPDDIEPNRHHHTPANKKSKKKKHSHEKPVETTSDQGDVVIVEFLDTNDTSITKFLM